MPPGTLTAAPQQPPAALTPAAEAKREGVHGFKPKQLTGYRSTVRPTFEITKAAGEALLSRIALFLDRTGGEAILDLNPPGLGRLAVRLVVEERATTLHIQASTEAVARFLERNLEPLRQALTAQGLEVSELSIGWGRNGENPARFAREAERKALAARPASPQETGAPDGEAPIRIAASLGPGGNGSALDLIV